MGDTANKYDINFFTPHTPFLKDNTRLIIISVVIWAIAVFGFHLLLKALEKPTPEPAYITYQNIWDHRTTASIQEKKELAKVYLTLVGKYIQLRSNDAVQQQFSLLADEIAPGRDKDNIAQSLGIKGDILAEAIPFGFSKGEIESDLSTEIPGIMDKYLIHNRSVLTDTTFLGFPLHYFYTAVFLKILFCMICLIYCKCIDSIMKKHGMETANE